jgi:TatA/E family protein of Tat protein translocase
MGSLGMQEIIVIFLIALIVFGPRKLPELGKTIGKGLAEFKKASNELKQTWEDEVRIDKEKESIPEPVPVPEPVNETTIQDTTVQDTTVQTSEVLNENNTAAEPKENQ